MDKTRLTAEGGKPQQWARQEPVQPEGPKPQGRQLAKPQQGLQQRHPVRGEVMHPQRVRLERTTPQEHQLARLPAKVVVLPQQVLQLKHPIWGEAGLPPKEQTGSAACRDADVRQAPQRSLGHPPKAAARARSQGHQIRRPPRQQQRRLQSCGGHLAISVYRGFL